MFRKETFFQIFSFLKNRTVHLLNSIFCPSLCTSLSQPDFNTSPSTTNPSSSMDESQQPFDTQQEPTTIRSQPASTEQQSTSPTTDMDEAKEAEEDKHMDHLTVISDNMETSKYTCTISFLTSDMTMTCFLLQTFFRTDQALFVASFRTLRVYWLWIHKLLSNQRF